MDSLFLHLASITLSIVGFFIAFYIYRKKRKKKPLICPLRSNCDAVVTSDYSKFLNIPLENIGMGYYAFLALLHSVLIVVGDSPLFSLMVLVFSGGAFLFSVYLISIQAFVLRQWCVWCLSSASISTIIFLITVFNLPPGIDTVLAPYVRLFTIVHLFGVAIGVGGATITDLLFFKFLRNYKISEEEASVMKTISNAIWAGLCLVVLSGFALFMIKPEMLLATPKFIVKMVGVVVLIVNGYLLNIIVQPKLIHISFGDTHDHKPGELVRLRRLSFALGAISITSWYFIFILGALRGVMGTLPLFFGIYLLALLSAVLGSQIFVLRLEKTVKV